MISAVCAVVLGTIPAQAATELVDWDQGTGTVIGTVHWVNPMAGGSNVDVETRIGGFNLYTVDTISNVATTYQGYCVDIFQDIEDGTYQGGALTDYLSPYGATIAATRADQLNALIANAVPGIDDAVSSAAMQLAVWEIVFDYSTTTAYSLSNGPFSVTGDDPALAEASALANTYLANIVGTNPIWQSDSSYTLSVLTSDRVQDQLIFARNLSAVPEPAVWAMMLVGFGAISVTLRGRRALARASSAMRA